MAKDNFKVGLKNNESYVSPDRFSNIFQVIDPSWLSGEWGSPDTEEDDSPKQLTLRIADEEDIDTIDRFFESRRKQEADPKGFVKPRPDDPVEGLAKNGRIALIEDDKGITALCFAFTHKVENLHGQDTPQVVTEIGTVISCAKGLGLTNIAISALSLALKEQDGIDHPIIAKVSKENKAANNLFSSAMAWDTIDSYSTIKPLFNSSAGNTIRSENECKSDYRASNSRNWYIFEEKAQTSAAELIRILKQDSVLAPKTGDSLDIPFFFDEDDFDFNSSLNSIISETPEIDTDPDERDQHLNINPDDPNYLEGADTSEDIIKPNDCHVLEHNTNADTERADAHISDHAGNIIPISLSKIYTYDSQDEEDVDEGAIYYDEALGMQ